MQGEGAHAERSQLDGVQQGHLGHAICFCATAGPVLVTLNLEVNERSGQRSSVSLKRVPVYGRRSKETAQVISGLQLIPLSSTKSVNPSRNRENISS